MMKPHCDYCEYELEGKHDPLGVPCTSCVELLKTALERKANVLEFPLGATTLSVPKQFVTDAWRGDQKSWAFRSILRKVKGFSRTFVTAPTN